MRKVELLPTRDCEAGYGPVTHSKMGIHLMGKWRETPLVMSKLDHQWYMLMFILIRWVQYYSHELSKNLFEMLILYHIFSAWPSM